jgi:ATP-dependent Clp protease ATP-binding subunit ClpA
LASARAGLRVFRSAAMQRIRPRSIVGAGSAEGALDASNIIKPALSRGELQCVGATTLNEYRKYIEKDAALERRFQKVKVEAPTLEEAVQILKGLRPKYETHHKVKLTDEALEAAVRLSDRYITGRFLPDKAIDIMDEAGARARINSMTRPPDVKEIEKTIETIRAEKEEAIRQEVVPHFEPIEAWIVDETGWLKQGKHSVGVAHQYCGAVGKQANCQVSVELVVSDGFVAAPVGGRLCLPQSWIEDPERCAEAGVPPMWALRPKMRSP